MRNLLEIPVIELMKLWGEFVEAYHHKHPYAGNVVL